MKREKVNPAALEDRKFDVFNALQFYRYEKVCHYL